jgi:hypothetical protein
MATETRKTGIDVVGDLPWGSHFCLFYETKEDLLGTSIPYCKSGLESEEFCLWVVAEPLTIEEATNALKDAMPGLDRYLADSGIEIMSARNWYLQGGTFDLKRVTDGWHEKLARASARGYAGVRVTGDTAWLAKKDWKHFYEYEEGLNEAVANQRLAVLCTYPLAQCGALEILDVVRTHQFALAKQLGRHRNRWAQASQGRNQATQRGARTTCHRTDRPTYAGLGSAAQGAVGTRTRHAPDKLGRTDRLDRARSEPAPRGGGEQRERLYALARQRTTQS